MATILIITGVFITPFLVWWCFKKYKQFPQKTIYSGKNEVEESVEEHKWKLKYPAYLCRLLTQSSWKLHLFPSWTFNMARCGDLFLLKKVGKLT